MGSDNQTARNWRDLADEIAHKVLDQIMPFLRQIRDDLADYAHAMTADRESEVRQTIPRLLSPKAAAKKFGVSAIRLKKEYHAGRVCGRRIGSHLRLLDESVAEWCRTRTDADPDAEPNTTRYPPQIRRGRVHLPNYLGR